jgi:dTDP-4-amino-4,6-dideoxygalactose transaminase
MLVSDDESAITKTRFWSAQARDKARHYEHSEPGYNYRMSNICAGIGRGQLVCLKKRINKKKSIYNKYKKAFSNIDEINMMPISDYGKPNYWLTVITIKEKSRIKPIDIISELEKNNIESRPVWKPMHLQPYFKRYNFFDHQDSKTPISNKIFSRGLCLPSGTAMTQKVHDRICDIITDLFSHNS